MGSSSIHSLSSILGTLVMGKVPGGQHLKMAALSHSTSCLATALVVFTTLVTMQVLAIYPLGVVGIYSCFPSRPSSRLTHILPWEFLGHRPGSLLKDVCIFAHRMSTASWPAVLSRFSLSAGPITLGTHSLFLLVPNMNPLLLFPGAFLTDLCLNSVSL